MSAPRYSFAPIDAMYPGVVGGCSPNGDPIDLNIPIHEALDISRVTLNRYRNEGLSTMVADQVAVKLGYNPGNIWPSWYDDAALEPSCAMCGEPVSGLRRYCCRLCAARAREQQRVA